MTREQLITILVEDRLNNASLEYFTEILQYGFKGFESFTLTELQTEVNSLD